MQGGYSMSINGTTYFFTAILLGPFLFIYFLVWLKEVIRIKTVINGPCKALKKEVKRIDTEIASLRRIALLAYQKSTLKEEHK